MRRDGSRTLERLRFPIAGVLVGATCLLLCGCGPDDWTQTAASQHTATAVAAAHAQRTMPEPTPASTAASAPAPDPASDPAPAPASDPAPAPAAALASDPAPTSTDSADAAPTTVQADPAPTGSTDAAVPRPAADPTPPTASEAPSSTPTAASTPDPTGTSTSTPAAVAASADPASSASDPSPTTTPTFPTCTPSDPAGTSATPVPTASGAGSPSASDSATPSMSASASASASATPSASAIPTSSTTPSATPSPIFSTVPPVPAPSGARPLAIYPFSATSPANRSIPASATFDSANGTMSSDLRSSGGTNVNSQSWSFAFYTATDADPVVQVRDPGSGSVQATIHLPADATTTSGSDAHMGVVQPDGYTAYEFYKMTKSGSGWTSPYVVRTDLRGDGLGGGTRASGTSIFWGVIRSQELQQASIRHSLLLGIPSSALKSGQVWPARLQDSFASRYSGSIPMGTLFAIPPSVDVTSLGLDREGLALAHALQQYGAYVMIQSSSTALYAEKSADPAQVSALKGPWQKLRPLLQAVTNNRP